MTPLLTRPTLFVSARSFPILLVAATAACGSTREGAVPVAQPAEVSGTRVVVRDTTIRAATLAHGVAEPVARATLSTKLMGTVMQVLVNEGDRVVAGQLLVRLDARDLDAKRQQVLSGIAGAEAAHDEALRQAERFRKLFADSAAPRAQLEAVEAGLARASAAVQAARAGEAELEAVTTYASVRAPFPGVVTQRLVDPGAFAAPGAPLLTLEDQRMLRLTASVAPEDARDLRRGQEIDAEIEGQAVRATVEGVVPSPAGALLSINAMVPNPRASLVSGGAAVLRVPRGTRATLLVPARAVRREGDLTGIRVVSGAHSTTRWIRLGETHGDALEVIAGLRAGDTVIVPTGSGKE